ncbi:MAG TPA: TPM domain-containing protein [Chitinophagaceae bacterium]|nr:TPM domain-containing protein [Chitinophagaceae bacterium]
MACSGYIRLLSLLLVVSALSAAGQQDTSKRQIPAGGLLPKPPSLFRDSLPLPLGYVNDYAHMFTDPQVSFLDSLLAGYERRTPIQVALVTFDSTMTTADSLDLLTRRIADYWGVGQSRAGYGVTIGISRDLRRMRIENGYGIAALLTDEETKQIIDDDFIPGYRKGDYFGGTCAGLQALMNRLAQRYRPGR